MPIVAPFLPYDKLRVIADDFLKQYHSSGDLVVSIEDIVDFKFDLDIVPVPGLLHSFDVDAFITSDLTAIMVDQFIQEKRPARYRFSLAHELAHVLVHQDVFKELKFSTIAEWKQVICSIPPSQYSWIEWQAYSLGGLMLVPPKPLAAIVRDKFEEAHAAGLNLHRADVNIRKRVESHIGTYFKVSREVISRRIKYDELWE